jgi:hypothetical protein
LNLAPYSSSSALRQQVSKTNDFTKHTNCLSEQVGGLDVPLEPKAKSPLAFANRAHNARDSSGRFDASRVEAELNLQDCYRKLFEHERGVGYPKERAAIMAKNRGILKQLKAASCKDMVTVLESVDQDLLKAAVAGEKFKELFFANCQDDAIASRVKRLVA